MMIFVIRYQVCLAIAGVIQLQYFMSLHLVVNQRVFHQFEVHELRFVGDSGEPASMYDLQTRVVVKETKNQGFVAVEEAPAEPPASMYDDQPQASSEFVTLPTQSPYFKKPRPRTCMCSVFSSLIVTLSVGLNSCCDILAVAMTLIDGIDPALMKTLSAPPTTVTLRSVQQQQEKSLQLRGGRATLPPARAGSVGPRSPNRMRASALVSLSGSLQLPDSMLLDADSQADAVSIASQQEARGTVLDISYPYGDTAKQRAPWGAEHNLAVTIGQSMFRDLPNKNPQASLYQLTSMGTLAEQPHMQNQVCMS
jgi:hypothetical protein